MMTKLEMIITLIISYDIISLNDNHNKHKIISGLNAVPQSLHMEVQVLILDYNQVIMQMIMTMMTMTMMTMTMMNLHTEVILDNFQKFQLDLNDNDENDNSDLAAGRECVHHKAAKLTKDLPSPLWDQGHDLLTIII